MSNKFPNTTMRGALPTLKAIEELIRARAERAAAEFLDILREPSIQRSEEFLLRCCDSTERPLRMLDLAHSVFDSGADKDFWPWVARWWSSFDAIPHGRFKALFAEFRVGWSPDCMDVEDRSAYDRLPERFTVYRGQSRAKRAGLSWTLNHAVAEGFARGHRCIVNTDPIVLEATLNKLDVAMMLHDREEEEVVVFAPPRSRFCRVVDLDQTPDVSS